MTTRQYRRSARPLERLMVAWGEGRPIRGRACLPWWETALVLAARGERLSTALSRGASTPEILHRATQPARAGIWVWEGRPDWAEGATLALDLAHGSWRLPSRVEWREVREPDSWTELSAALRVRPASHSRWQRIAEIAAALEAYPGQLEGQTHDLDALVIPLEVEGEPGGPAVSLAQLLAAARVFEVIITASDGSLEVALALNGWRVERRWPLGSAVPVPGR